MREYIITHHTGVYPKSTTVVKRFDNMTEAFKFYDALVEDKQEHCIKCFFDDITLFFRYWSKSSAKESKKCVHNWVSLAYKDL